MTVRFSAGLTDDNACRGHNKHARSAHYKHRAKPAQSEARSAVIFLAHVRKPWVSREDNTQFLAAAGSRAALMLEQSAIKRMTANSSAERPSLQPTVTHSMRITLRQALKRGWLWSAAISLVLCALLFGWTEMRDRCWLNWPYYTLSKFAITWLWLLCFAALKGRVALLALAVPVLVYWAAGAVDGQHSAILSVSAVGRIRQLHQAMADYKAQHQKFPETLPHTSPGSRIDNYYAFELIPSRAA